MPSVEAHDERSTGDELVEIAHSPALVRQFEARHGLADLRRAMPEIPAFEPVDEALSRWEERRLPFSLLLDEEFEPAPKRRVKLANLVERGG